MTPPPLCVDSSFTLLLVLIESRSARADALWDQWVQDDIERVVPPAYFVEGVSVIRNRVHRRLMTQQEGEEALALFLSFPVTSVTLPNLPQQAWDLATRYGLPQAYDAQYLAVATELGCDFWTGDGPLARSVGEPWVRLMA